MNADLSSKLSQVIEQIPEDVYHTFIPHEDGTAIFEAKDRAYEPIGEEDILEL